MKVVWTVFMIYLFLKKTIWKFCVLSYMLQAYLKEFYNRFWYFWAVTWIFYLSFEKLKFIKFCLKAFQIFSRRRNEISI